MTRRKGQGNYDADFKLEAVKLVVDQGCSIQEAAAAVNVGKSTLDKWVRQYKQEKRGFVASSSPLTAEQRRIKELEMRLKQAERENDILKKASALLISDSLKNIK